MSAARGARTSCGSWGFAKSFSIAPVDSVKFDGLVEINAVVKGDIAQGLGRNIAGENDEWSLSIELCLSLCET